MLRVGVLGAGFMGGTHARAFAKLPDVQVLGVSSRSAEKAAVLAEEVGAEPFTDAMALTTHPQVDVVSVTLPTHLHEEYTVAALNSGNVSFVKSLIPVFILIIFRTPFSLNMSAAPAPAAKARPNALAASGIDVPINPAKSPMTGINLSDSAPNDSNAAAASTTS